MTVRTVEQVGVMFRGGVLMALTVAGVACQRPSTSDADRARALDIIQKRASAAEREGCPAEVVTEREVAFKDFTTYCHAGLSRCAMQCFETDAIACYALAIIIEKDEATEKWAAPLFYRACALGVSSGCTNRAAGLQLLEQPDDQVLSCAARTFEKTCALGDPWGCTMHGQNLMEGTGLPRDVKKAREVLAAACTRGEEDPACQAASDLKADLDELEPEPSPK